MEFFFFPSCEKSIDMRSLSFGEFTRCVEFPFDGLLRAEPKLSVLVCSKYSDDARKLLLAVGEGLEEFREIPEVDVWFGDVVR